MAKGFAADSPAIVPVVQTRFNLLGALSFSHFLNDMMQSLIVSIYPLLKGEFHLSFVQIGTITLTYQICASLLQPLIGIYTDKHPKPYSLSIGMCFTMVGIVTLAFAPSYGSVLVAAALIGAGSAIFHPESSRIARLASGGRHGLAQSIFQVGGNVGSAIGPLLAAFIVLPFGQKSVAWFALFALLGIFVLTQVGHWARTHGFARLAPRVRKEGTEPAFSPRRVRAAIAVLLALIFSKYFYLASLTSYYTFYLIEHFRVGVRDAQIMLFAFLAAVALGTIFGGPLGDRFGRKIVIWVSILGVLPFTLLLPHANLFWTILLTLPIGFILASAFPAIVVYAQELMPGKTGTVAGLFFGFAFGMGAIGAAVLGALADATSIEFVYRVCAWLPLVGLLAVLLPNIEEKHAQAA